MAIQRWTDEMLDNLASSVSEVKESVSEVKESVSEVKESVTELRESVTEMRKGMEILRDTTQGLIEVAAKQERRMDRLDREQAESNKRFDVLLGEIRYLIRGQQEGGNS